MNNNFVNRKDRIIASAIEIISEAGLSSLNTKSLAMKENMSESLLYRYFGGIEEVLVEVIETYTKFDKSMLATIDAKKISHFDKVLELLRTLGTYYAGYQEMSAIALNYEELLHNVNTREAIAHCIKMRTEFIRQHLKAAMEEGEIRDDFSPEELSNIFMGSLSRDLLNRRIEYDHTSHTQFADSMLEHLANMLRTDK
ncbi:MAG: TetR/AcrR family transcriptional regulator [Lachnospiraceae bacterium]|nr:TetR/AcrR family transcriptional regulator [Lachnospiraceae bacterium]HCJ08471.1 TetR/AcrR family transcriptional regulator [Lachnospiraceae bacterium]